MFLEGWYNILCSVLDGETAISKPVQVTNMTYFVSGGHNTEIKTETTQEKEVKLTLNFCSPGENPPLCKWLLRSPCVTSSPMYEVYVGREDAGMLWLRVIQQRFQPVLC